MCTSLCSLWTTPAGSILSATIRMGAMERIPSLRYIREAYALNECGIVTLTYPREKKNSVSFKNVYFCYKNRPMKLSYHRIIERFSHSLSVLNETVNIRINGHNIKHLHLKSIGAICYTALAGYDNIQVFAKYLIKLSYTYSAFFHSKCMHSKNNLWNLLYVEI